MPQSAESRGATWRARGAQTAARSLPRLRAANITHVVNCTDTIPNFHESAATAGASGQWVYACVGVGLLRLAWAPRTTAYMPRVQALCTTGFTLRSGGGTAS